MEGSTARALEKASNTHIIAWMFALSRKDVSGKFILLPSALIPPTVPIWYVQGDDRRLERTNLVHHG